jgi:hypothetical protein
LTRASDALVIARGDVRDGVAAIEHFREVLASRRVGPRVLARSLPEVLAGLAPLRASVAALIEALAAELAADPEGADAVRDLLGHAIHLVDDLAAALPAHESDSLDARARLALEAVVRRIAGDLGAIVRLVDLLGAPATSETTTIDLGDALAQRRSQARKTATQVLASVDVRTSELTVGDARLVLSLLEFAVSTVFRAGVDSPRIIVDLGPEGFPRFTVDASPTRIKDGSGGEGQIFDVEKREALPREADVVRAAARHAGISLSIEDGGRKVTIAL